MNSAPSFINMSKKLPLVVVLGATACGKSKLAIELARKFDGEIISADSMQVYRGLDIVTNKVTDKEQQLAKHHMMNFVHPLSRYSVIDFRDQSLQLIDDLFARKKIPIIVGGTHYYIESLLWKCFTHDKRTEIMKKQNDDKYIQSESGHHATLFDVEAHLSKTIDESKLHCDEDFEYPEKFFKKPILSLGMKRFSAEKLWNILEQVDPNSAHTFHPNDKRRVIRMLQLIQQKNKTYSEYIDSVNKTTDDDTTDSLGGPLRFDNVCVFWLNSEEGTLNQVLDDRVNQMLDRGLLSELEKFHDDFNKIRINEKGIEAKYDMGIFQSIGFKEFHDYFIMDEEARASTKGNKILARSIEDMKCSTRRYARNQLKWIKRRFLRKGSRQLPPIYKLEVCFDEAGWNEKVKKPAIKILESVMGVSSSDDCVRLHKVEPAIQERGKFEPGKYHCDICDRMIIGKINIDIHLQSRNHERRARSQRAKKAKLETDTENPLCDKCNDDNIPLDGNVTN